MSAGLGFPRQEKTGLQRLMRALPAWALLAATLGASLASHDHSLFSSGDATHAESRYLTRHDPLSHAKHWHAVLAVVHEHDCIACHNQRLAGMIGQARDQRHTVSQPAHTVLPVARALAASLSSSASRAPPTLL